MTRKQEAFLLFIGDILTLVLGLWLALLVRSLTVPAGSLFLLHLKPFSFIFVLSALSFFIVGLYEAHKVSVRNHLFEIILKTQLANISLSIAFFYFFPHETLAPKTLLFLYGIFSTVLLVIWRVFAEIRFAKMERQRVLLVAAGEEAELLKKEIALNKRYGMEIVYSIDPSALASLDFGKDILEKIYEENIKLVVVDSKNEKILPLLPHFYNLIFSHIQFVELSKFFERVFYRVPVSSLQHGWFLENISTAPRKFYDLLKRVMDTLIAIPLTILFSPFFLLGAILVKLHDGGEVFSIQTRVGKSGHPIRLLKLRTMHFNDDGNWKESGEKNGVTKVGHFLRKSRIDEIPQLLNVLMGDLSLIGPRPEFPKAVAEYAKEIDYYNIRHMIKPGLSGWAQIYHDEHPHHNDPENVRKTKDKLSYDIYYVKNRSLILDIIIALKTIKTLLSREGR